MGELLDQSALSGLRSGIRTQVSALVAGSPDASRNLAASLA